MIRADVYFSINQSLMYIFKARTISFATNITQTDKNDEKTQKVDSQGHRYTQSWALESLSIRPLFSFTQPNNSHLFTLIISIWHVDSFSLYVELYRQSLAIPLRYLIIFLPVILEILFQLHVISLDFYIIKFVLRFHTFSHTFPSPLSLRLIQYPGRWDHE